MQVSQPIIVNGILDFRWLSSLMVRVLGSWRDGCNFNSWLPLLVPGWVTVFGQINHLSISPSHPPTQPSTLSGTGNKYQPKCGDALQLGSNVKLI